ITTFRDTIVLVDKNGNPLRPAILWLDKRMASGKASLPFFSNAIVHAIGMKSTIDLQYAKSHCNWIRENEKDIWQKADKFLMLSSYLIFKLTGIIADSDASPIGHVPYNNKKRMWQKKSEITYPVFPVEKEKLPDLVKTGNVIGKISKQMASDSGLKEGLPLIATGSDKACEVLGLACIEKERAAVSLGTAATITFMSKKYVEPEPFLPPFAACIPNCWNPEYQIYRGYWLISWFKKEFAFSELQEAEKLGISVEQFLDATLNNIPPGCDGLIVQPYFTPGITMPAAHGAIIGLSDIHTRLHIYRAIVEGINYALRYGKEIMERRSGNKFTSIAIGGGGSQSNEICQITADIFGVPVTRMKSFEAASMGSALCSFVGIGAFSNYEEGVKAMIHEERQFFVRKEISEKYKTLYESIYKETYPRLRPIYERLQGIYGKGHS
ncbi:MAG: FGGY-family carbohydrate kinase, partial [Treponema sp.]|nr:FGGY-family carbohydrate kinase [Treponema sp.]